MLAYDSVPMPGRRNSARVVREDLTTAVLQILSGSDKPTGSSVIHERLLGSGFRLSEPTVGRLLRALDRLGYTTRRGHLGRTLTPAGQTQLTQLRRTEHRAGNVREIVEHLRADTLESVINVLHARRGVEREIARAAATNRTARDLVRLRARYDAMRRGEQHPEGLHEMLAHAAHNPVLESLYRAIREDPDVSLVVDEIATERGTHVDIRFNQRLLAALDKRDEDAAERAVVDHMDELLKTVRARWKQPRGARRPPLSAKRQNARAAG